jgi:hypothetical protein
MKKVIASLAFLFCLSASTLMAQQEGNFNPSKMKERQLQQLKESDLKLTDAQADSVVSINMETRRQMKDFRDLSEDQRRSKMKEMKEYRLKRWSEALKDESLAKKVEDYYAAQRANRMNGRGKQS